MKTGESNTSGEFDQFNTGGFEIARGSSSVRDNLAPDLGMIRYNTDIKRPEAYTNQGWKKLLIDSDLGTGTIEDAIGVKLRAAKKMGTMTIMFQGGSGAAGAPRFSSGGGSQPSWLSVTHKQNSCSFYKNASSTHGQNYFVYKTNLGSVCWGSQYSCVTGSWKNRRWLPRPPRGHWYQGEFDVDIFKMLNLPGTRWDYVYTGFGGMCATSGMINRGYPITSSCRWTPLHNTSPDTTSSKDIDSNYGKYRLYLKYGPAGRRNHTSGFSFYFSGRKFKKF